MKTTKKVLLGLMVIAVFNTTIIAQQMFHIHEDIVKPAMSMEYENVIAELYSILKANPIQETEMMAFQASNNHYFWISPISSMADLDKPSPIEKLAQKAGKDKVMALANKMDKCYDVERNYIIILDEQLSYMPDGMTLTPEGENYREHYKLHVTPGNRAMVREKMQNVKNMFVKNNSKMHYRVYRSGFGTESEYYLVSVSAKDEMHMAEKSKANETLMGDSGRQTMFDMFQNILTIEEMEGFMRPEWAYKSE